VALFSWDKACVAMDTVHAISAVTLWGSYTQANNSVAGVIGLLCLTAATVTLHVRHLADSVTSGVLPQAACSAVSAVPQNCNDAEIQGIPKV